MKNTLHVYPQVQWHDSAYIVGDEEALLKLRDAIDRALVSNRDKCLTFINDGEGYEIHVIKTDETTMDKMGVPYTAEIAAERHWDDKIEYWKLNKENKK